jgi:uncharacterized membrane protein
MGNLSNVGRVFYGIAIAAIGFLTIYYHDFPYMLIPPKHTWLNDHLFIVYISGAFLFVAGAAIVLEKMTMPVSLVLGAVLLAIFCFYFIPYEFFVSSTYMQFGQWENAAKELALAGGAFVIAGRTLRKVYNFGRIVYALTIISFSIDHFIYGKDAADYIPSWIPYHVFWIYFAGVALLAAGIGILLKIRLRLAAALLGAMIFIWVIILHIPKAIANPADNQTGEVTSGLIALAYCGIALVIAGVGNSREPVE